MRLSLPAVSVLLVPSDDDTRDLVPLSVLAPVEEEGLALLLWPQRVEVEGLLGATPVVARFWVEVE